MRPVEALYENGLLRPAKPLNLRPGERVGVIVVRQADPSRWDLARLAATSTDDAELAAVARPTTGGVRGSDLLLRKMNPPGFWTVLALAQPGLFALLWSFTLPGVRLATWCHVGLARLAYRNFVVIILLCVVIIAAIALTFMAHALRNTNLGWGMRIWWATALLLFSPIIAPAYWMFHLRSS